MLPLLLLALPLALLLLLLLLLAAANDDDDDDEAAGAVAGSPLPRPLHWLSSSPILLRSGELRGELNALEPPPPRWLLLLLLLLSEARALPAQKEREEEAPRAASKVSIVGGRRTLVAMRALPLALLLIGRPLLPPPPPPLAPPPVTLPKCHCWAIGPAMTGGGGLALALPALLRDEADTMFMPPGACSSRHLSKMVRSDERQMSWTVIATSDGQLARISAKRSGVTAA